MQSIRTEELFCFWFLCSVFVFFVCLFVVFGVFVFVSVLFLLFFAKGSSKKLNFLHILRAYDLKVEPNEG